VRRKAALRATDDPDTVDGIEYASSPYWHVYDIWGSTYGDAPSAIKRWFNRAAKQLSKGQRRKASKSLGYLAHMLGDLANPMHTDQTSKEELIHSSYESAVDQVFTDFRFSYDGRDKASPYKTAVRLAKTSHKKYDSLVNKFDLNGLNAKVRTITRTQLVRGANAVADLAARIKARATKLNKAGGSGNGGGGGGGGSDTSKCSPAYPGVCIPPPPPDLDCDDIPHSGFSVKQPDPHGFDGDNNGIGCE
jgi:hypothetical protein